MGRASDPTSGRRPDCLHNFVSATAAQVDRQRQWCNPTGCQCENPGYSCAWLGTPWDGCVKSYCIPGMTILPSFASGTAGSLNVQFMPKESLTGQLQTRKRFLVDLLINFFVNAPYHDETLLYDVTIPSSHWIGTTSVSSTVPTLGMWLYLPHQHILPYRLNPITWIARRKLGAYHSNLPSFVIGRLDRCG